MVELAKKTNLFLNIENLKIHQLKFCFLEKEEHLSGGTFPELHWYVEPTMCHFTNTTPTTLTTPLPPHPVKASARTGKLGRKTTKLIT